MDTVFPDHRGPANGRVFVVGVIVSSCCARHRFHGSGDGADCLSLMHDGHRVDPCDGMSHRVPIPEVTRCITPFFLGPGWSQSHGVFLMKILTDREYSFSTATEREFVSVILHRQVPTFVVQRNR